MPAEILQREMMPIYEFTVANIVHDITIIFSYFLVGVFLKYIDQAYDINVFNKQLAVLLAVPTAVIMALLVVLDPPSASIFMAIALGVAVAGKIDNIAFRIGVGLLILVPIFFSDVITLMWLPFGLLVLSAVVDEHGNDWSDEFKRKNKKNKKTLNQKILSSFFDHRSTMKVMMIALTATNQIPLLYLPAFFLFDLGYRITEEISFKYKPYRLKHPLTDKKVGTWPNWREIIYSTKNIE